MELDMECRASLIYAHLLSPELDAEDVRRGQLLTVLTAVSILLLSQMFIALVNAVT
jgi:hypothetical protein